MKLHLDTDLGGDIDDPQALEGYRRVGAVEEDANLEARIVWRHLQLGVLTIPRGPQPK